MASEATKLQMFFILPKPAAHKIMNAKKEKMAITESVSAFRSIWSVRLRKEP